MTRRLLLIALSVLLVGAAAPAGLRVAASEHPALATLLPDGILTAMANEVSGSQAYQFVVDMVGYEHDRTPDEYGTGTMHEAVYMAAKAKALGLGTVTIERFPEGTAWDGEAAELWIEEPREARRMVTRYRDLPATLALGSVTSDVTAELVYVGRGTREQDYQGRDVKGKVVLVSGPVAQAHDLAVRRFGAAGVLSYYNGTGKPVDRPDQIAWGSLVSRQPDAAPGAPKPVTTFGFMLSRRMGTELIDLLDENPKVVVRATVKATQYPVDMPAVVATIPGDGSGGPSEKNEVVFVAHLFEGTAKQGANDNAGGPAVQLEMARAWLALIANGTLPRPRRTVRFLWVPEISGTMEYLERYPDTARHVLGAVNMDMVGADQSKNHNHLELNLTPWSLPSFLNDVSAQFTEYVGDTNREKVENSFGGFVFSRPIVDPKGSQDPFWFSIERYFGASDHEVFLGASPRVPAVNFGDWPDAVYHTSEDTPAFLDPTQMKRAAFIGLAIGHVMASFSDGDALAVASFSAGYGRRRVAENVKDALTSLALATRDTLPGAYREARNLVRCAYDRERRWILSAAGLAGSGAPAATGIASLAEAFARGATPDLDQVRAAYEARCAALGMAAAPAAPPGAEERAASRLVPRQVAQAPGRAGRGMRRQHLALTGDTAWEARNFADGTRSILDIRNEISAEFGPIALADVVTFFRELEKTGAWTVVEGQPKL